MTDHHDVAAERIEMPGGWYFVEAEQAPGWFGLYAPDEIFTLALIEGNRARAFAAAIRPERDVAAERIDLPNGWYFAEDEQTQGWFRLCSPDGKSTLALIEGDLARTFAAANRPAAPPSADFVKLVDEYGRAAINAFWHTPGRDLTKANDATRAARAAVLDALAAQKGEIERLIATRDASDRHFTGLVASLDTLRAELARLKAARVPEGFTLVPTNATRDMIDELRNRITQWSSLEPAYYWMLQAAPILASETAAPAPAQASQNALRKALEAAKHWHEAEDKAMSKIGYYRRRDRHREQIKAINAALNPTGDA